MVGSILGVMLSNCPIYDKRNYADKQKDPVGREPSLKPL